MRTIKFRCWNGYKMMNNIHKQQEFIAILCDKKDWSQYILQQYTGLRDKNGKEIFEGDILRIWNRKDYLKKIVFESGSFVTKDIDGKIGDGYGGSLWVNRKFVKKDTEVIGNIYSNPELLK